MGFMMHLFYDIFMTEFSGFLAKKQMQEKSKSSMSLMCSDVFRRGFYGEKMAYICGLKR